jgi:hypothetical protein
LIAIAIIILVCLIAFHKTIFYFYANDDFEVARCYCKVSKLVDKVSQGKPVKICKVCNLKERKEAKNLWQLIDWHIRGSQYTHFKLAHCLTLGIHIINSILIYLAFGSNNQSLVMALLFSIHPVATQGSSVWLSGKGYGIATALVLTMYWLKWITPLAYFGTFFFSMNGLLAPAMFIGTAYWYMILLIPIFIIWKWETIWRACEMKWTIIRQSRNPITWDNVILFFKTIGYYFWMCVFPTKLGVHHTYLATYGLTKEETKQWMKLDGYFYLGVALTAALLITKNFGLFWFFLFLLQWSNIITIHMFIAERYCTIPLIGVLYLISQVINSTALMQYRYLLFTAAFVYYWARTSAYLPIYENLLMCIEENTRNFQDSVVAWTWRGGVENNLEMVNKSFDSWLRAWQLRPYDLRLNINIAALFAGRGQYDQAENFLDMAAKSPCLNKKQEAFRDQRVALMREQLKVSRGGKK